MADLSVKHDDSVKAKENSAKPAAPSDEGTENKVLILDSSHVVKGVPMSQACCRHLTKFASAELAKFPIVVIEHTNSEGQGVWRVIKDAGFSTDPFYIDFSQRILNWEILADGSVKTWKREEVVTR